MVEIKRAIKELLEEGPSGLDLDDLDNIQHVRRGQRTPEG